MTINKRLIMPISKNLIKWPLAKKGTLRKPQE